MCFNQTAVYLFLKLPSPVHQTHILGPGLGPLAGGPCHPAHPGGPGRHHRAHRGRHLLRGAGGRRHVADGVAGAHEVGLFCLVDVEVLEAMIVRGRGGGGGMGVPRVVCRCSSTWSSSSSRASPSCPPLRNRRPPLRSGVSCPANLEGWGMVAPLHLTQPAGRVAEVFPPSSARDTHATMLPTGSSTISPTAQNISCQSYKTHLLLQKHQG